MRWKLRDFVLQSVVKIFVVILYKIYRKDKIQIYFTYWVLNMIIKLLCLLAGRSAVDIWWWPYWGWGVLCRVNADSPWWQWQKLKEILIFRRVWISAFSAVRLRVRLRVLCGQCCSLASESKRNVFRHVETWNVIEICHDIGGTCCLHI